MVTLQAQDTSCPSVDPLTIPSIQREINLFPVINVAGEICLFANQVIQFEHNGATHFRVEILSNPYRPDCTI